jgi:hemoglobin
MTLVSDKMDHVTEDGIRQLVDAFYTKVRVDSELGLVFENKIKDNWPHHLEKMYAFWSSVMLTSGRYKGNPMMKHMVIPGMKPELFTQWLSLFEATCRELCDDTIRAAFMEKAERIAESLKIAIFYRPDRPWPPQASASLT